VAIGSFSLWRLAGFRCGDWQVFVVAIGSFLLWHLAGFRRMLGGENAAVPKKDGQIICKSKIVMIFYYL
jgi:hypothetical protein